MFTIGEWSESGVSWCVQTTNDEMQFSDEWLYDNALCV